MTVRLLHYSDLETALDEPEQCGALAGTIAALRDEETVLVGSGDNTAPGALSLETTGRIAVSFFELVEPDADTFGNHDFDFGSDTARELADAAPQEWLCANATVDGERFADAETEPSTLVEAGAEQVGIVGVAHPKTDVMNPAAEDVTFEDPVQAVRQEANRLREAGADYVVVISHCGRTDERIAAETDVDAVVGGHVHDVHEAVVEGTAVVRPGRAGRYVSEVVLGDDARTAVHQVDDGHVDDDVVALLREKHSEYGLDEVVTTVETPIPRTEEAATTAGSTIGSLVTDALRWKTGADVALSPPGGIRSGDPLVGDVTVSDIISLSPYEDELALVELSGERLREAFVAVPFGYHDDGFPDRHCSHVSGARLRWDDEVGELVEATVDGEPLDPDETYTLAADDYVIETNHVNDAFGEDDVIERYGLGRDAIVEFAREVGFDGETTRRVERPRLDEPPEQTN
ncbi:2',3'-cyclic-nucleotide 2'-phosphodiesterase/5'-or 3'-nucleotidase, 5'-nucleotidase family [Halovenus aranensis]|jgi:2',3'-cyclic-nucleotide 2'-phosphodiesterase (5'-nucleotidase family)|uniref:2',3'-cyclic-nucleotide 2'-phosphodiesterase/5'-or 3'-nucleotidase, 5'-nucleotidase family n=1 Tax=Halovenus aranensis TaxID=890420 RepID=A0A1G8T6K0_9EURY|nr:bifunctional metallophosphatase/5'-nucleotidase [Halovenus aranensis]SDJ36310.1 2',3'-cyclic-nucleotide 2'-phosphodiesterase/5'-or 3'-nucleotidase, 5'-nucleotidase family [Halovenus aranensis]